ncbi:MAG: nucleic acid binding OB-fold tRNA/helicase-type [Candidatus Parvarchaeum acidiphilum ARMAN-4]|uniref:Nucleic acid binding OB-fold tRNA/helicase-type n=1 Tax=Candidatus Parvarchaeum acidiphilum ARMAN-4 TaxID=662760 RepID=D2EFW8_PARA4|nr:MAG: nucleic acid binding OB-fold tRNA/helicase-type [Candidatus Parvarchaeum acidiphilum ARMAN-4]
MKISELRDGMSDIDLSAEVVEIGEAREVMTKFGSNKVATAKIKDDSGECKLSLWGKQIEMFSVGDNVEISKGYVQSFRDELQVNVGKAGSIRKL